MLQWFQKLKGLGVCCRLWLRAEWRGKYSVELEDSVLVHGLGNKYNCKIYGEWLVIKWEEGRDSKIS